MAVKTTTLKTKTGDNVYPNIIGTNRKDSFADSSTIKHYYYNQTHKVGFQLANTTNTKIQNSLQKPVGLTKTELVGVGTNGQENIEIGDNLTLSNGKLSATGGGSEGSVNVLGVDLTSGLVTGEIKVDNINFGVTSDSKFSLTGILTYDIPNLYKVVYTLVPELDADASATGNLQMITIKYDFASKQTKVVNRNILLKNYSHFVTLTKDNDVIYLHYQNTDEDHVNTIDGLTIALTNKKVICVGVLGNSDDTLATPMYVSGEGGNLNVYYVLKTGQGDSIQSKNIYDYEVTDDVTPADNVRVI